MSIYTEEQARTGLCVLALAETASTQRCISSECRAWRWVPLSADAPAFKAAIAAAMRDQVSAKGKPLAHREAVAWVMENRAALGLPTEPTHGYCGLGGKP